MEFKYDSDVRQLSILDTNYINIPSLLSKTGAMAPYDATYQAIQVLETDTDFSLKKYTDTVVVTTGVYHTIILKAVFGFDGVLSSAEISKLLTRYAYYVVSNEIKYSNGLLILKQTLPDDEETIDPIPKPKSKQLLSVYDVRAMPFKQKNYE